MHTSENPSAPLLALLNNPRPDLDPDPIPSALAAAIAERHPGSYVESDEEGNPRVVYPPEWLRQCGSSIDSIIANLDREIQEGRREMGLAA